MKILTWCFTFSLITLCLSTRKCRQSLHPREKLEKLTTLHYYRPHHTMGMGCHPIIPIPILTIIFERHRNMSHWSKSNLREKEMPFDERGNCGQRDCGRTVGVIPRPRLLQRRQHFARRGKCGGKRVNMGTWCYGGRGLRWKGHCWCWSSWWNCFGWGHKHGGNCVTSKLTGGQILDDFFDEYARFKTQTHTQQSTVR